MRSRREDKAEEETAGKRAGKASLATLLGLAARNRATDFAETLDGAGAVARAAPLAIAAHITAAAATALLQPGGALVVGLSAVAAALLLDALPFLLVRRQFVGRLRPVAVSRLFALLGALGGGAWGGAFAFLLIRSGTPPNPVAVAAMAAGLLVGLLSLTAIPVAAVAHAFAFALVLAGIALDPALGAALAGGAVLFAAMLIVEARHRESASSAGRERLHARHKASLLLADFEESGRGWFWETDTEGRLTYITPALAARLGHDPAQMLGTPLTALAVHDRDGQTGASPIERTIGFHLNAKIAFADLVVRHAGSEGHWWSLSGCPITDDSGRFAGFRGSGADLTEMREADAEIARLAKYDVLTGLPNRLLMRQTLDAALHGAAAKRQDCALFLLDLDRFKNVNDTLGHPVGDALLQQVAQRLQHIVGDHGRVGRLGGDEFNVVVGNMPDRAELAELAEAIIARLSLPYVIEGSTVSIGASIGIAISPFDGDCTDDLVRNADLALYAAKENGRGVHRFYQPDMHAEAKDRRLLEIDLREVLNGNELHLLYQPIVKADTEEVVGFEALVRWDHPVRGLVSPNSFIPIAEEIGLIPRIGEWVIRTACAEAARWPENLRLAVNLSPLQFASPGLPAIIVNALSTSGLEPHRLELELTEGVFLNDGEAADAMFASLKRIGVRLALDDFGTGYASLANLKRGPFDKIKIDQSFVRGAAIEDSRNAPILRAIVALAESLGMETTAEGAETLDEVALIRSLGCSQIQGFIFGRPMTADEALEKANRAAAATARVGQVEREPRLAVLRFAMLHSDGQRYPVRIRNISTGGAMIELDDDAALGSALEIELSAQHKIAGDLRWMSGRRFGVAFCEKLAAEHLAPPPNVKALKAEPEADDAPIVRKGRRT